MTPKQARQRISYAVNTGAIGPKKARYMHRQIDRIIGDVDDDNDRSRQLEIWSDHTNIMFFPKALSTGFAIRR